MEKKHGRSQPWGKLVKVDTQSEVLLVNRECTVGRRKGCDLSFPANKLVSGDHCKIVQDKSSGLVWLEDTSTNGTVINMSKLVKMQIHMLQNGDVIYFVYRKNEPEQNLAYMYQSIKPERTFSQDTIGGATRCSVMQQKAQTCPVTAAVCVSVEPFLVGPPREQHALDEPQPSTSSHLLHTVSSSTACSSAASLLHSSALDTRQTEAQNRVTMLYKEEEGDMEPERKRRKTDSADKDYDFGLPHTSSIAAVGPSPAKVFLIGDLFGKAAVAVTVEEAKTDKMEESLTCIICQDLLHDCVSLQPCMHTFCAACYSGWMERSSLCPTCRCPVERIRKNHILNNLVEAYLIQHPEKCRSEEDLKSMDSRNKITRDMLQPKIERSFSDEEGSSDYLFELSDNDSDTSDIGQPVVMCRQCPGYRKEVSQVLWATGLAPLGPVLPAHLGPVLPAHLGPVLPAHLGPVLPALLGPVLPAHLGPAPPAPLGPVLPAPLGPVLPAHLGPVLPAHLGPAPPAPLGPVLPAPLGPVLPAHLGPVLPAHLGPVLPAHLGPVLPAHLGPVLPAHLGPAPPAPLGPVLPAPLGPVLPAHLGPVLPAHLGPVLPAHLGPVLPAHLGPVLPAHLGPVLPAHLGPVLPAHLGPAPPAPLGPVLPAPLGPVLPAHLGPAPPAPLGPVPLGPAPPALLGPAPPALLGPAPPALLGPAPPALLGPAPPALLGPVLPAPLGPAPLGPAPPAPLGPAPPAPLGPAPPAPLGPAPPAPLGPAPPAPLGPAPPALLGPVLPAPLGPAPLGPAPLGPAPPAPLGPVLPAPLGPAPLGPAPLGPAPLGPAPPAPLGPAPLGPAPPALLGPAPSTPEDRPGKPPGAGESTLSTCSDVPTTAPQDYTCPPLGSHVICTCCLQPMPDRRAELIGQQLSAQQCVACLRPFCHMYWGCQRIGCQGCLARFSELNLTDKCLDGVLNSNNYESEILQSYLSARGMSWRDMLQEGLQGLQQGTFYLSDYRINSNAILCFCCGLRAFGELAYKYRQNIPASALPAVVTSRPDCYWGRNCRTQVKAHHATKFNHICEQTRFKS